VRRLLVTANVVPSSPILVTLMMEAHSSSATPVLTRATRRNIPEDGVLPSLRRENLERYNVRDLPNSSVLWKPELGLGNRKEIMRKTDEGKFGELHSGEETVIST
jgi:hypothetical protein